MSTKSGNILSPRSEGKRIAIVLPSLGGGGAEWVSIHLAAEFILLGHEVDFVLLQKTGELLSQIPAGASLIDLGVNRIRSAPSQIRRYVRECQPDGMIANMWPLTAAAVVAVKLLNRKEKPKLLLCDHGMLSLNRLNKGLVRRLFLRSSLRALYPLADARVVVSAAVASDVAKLGFLKRTSIEVVYNAIGREYFDAAESRSAALEKKVEIFGSRENRDISTPGLKRILTIGTLREEKNHQHLLRAFKFLLSQIDAKLTIVGAGPKLNSLEQFANELGISANVEFAGFQQDVIPYYEQADAFVLSSKHEGLGNVLGEALLMGVPVICTDCPGGPREILCDGQFGKLIPIGDEAALAEAMQQACTGGRVQGNGLDEHLKKFNSASVAQKYLEKLFGN